MKTEDIRKMAQAWQQVQEASKKNEELVGNQHKLDHNKNGKIDAADFKGLRKKSKKDQEVEVQTSEATVNEISKKTLGSYVKKASDDMADNAYTLGARDPLKPKGSWNKAFKRRKGIEKATDRLTKEEVEQIDEISKKTLSSYINKAAGDAVVRSYKAGDVRDKDSFKNHTKALGRQIGISKAVKKLAKEEVELDEGFSRVDYKKHGATFAKLRKQAQAKVDKEIDPKYKSSKKSEIRKDLKEETNWLVYERIKENRAAHYKGATKPETMDDKLKGKGAKDMANQPVNTSDIPSTHPSDIQKASAVKKAPARTGDQTRGDSSIVNPVKDTTK